MGPGPVGVDPRVLRAMSMPMLGQFDPAFTAYMNETMELLRAALSHQEPVVAAGRRHRARRHRGDPGLADRAGRQGAGADLRALRPSAGGNRRALRRRGRHHRARMGHGVHAGRDRGRDQAAPAARRSRWCTATPRPRWRSRSTRSARSAASTTCCSTADATATLGGMNVAIDAWKHRCGVVRACRNACPARPAPRRSPSTSASSTRSRSAASMSKPASGRPVSSTATDRVIQSNYFDLAHADGLLERDAAQPSHRGDLDALRRARGGAHRAGGGARRLLRAPHASPATRITAGFTRDGARAVRRSDQQDAERHRRLSSRTASTATRVRSDDAERFRHRDRHLVRSAARQDLAHRHHGLRLPQGERADLPRRARSLPAALRLRRRPAPASMRRSPSMARPADLPHSGQGSRQQFRNCAKLRT